MTSSFPPSQDDDEEMVGTKPLFDQREKLLQVVRLLITPHRLDLAGDLERELPVPRHGVAHLANLKGNK